MATASGTPGTSPSLEKTARSISLRRGARSTLRPLSAVVLLTFVVCHLTNHSLLLVSVALANAGHQWLIDPWRTDAGSAVLLTAALMHYGNALWSIYVRRHLRLSRWEWAQLLLGLSIPPLLMMHVTGTRFAEALLQANNDYTSVLLTQWVLVPQLAAVQVAAVLTVWLHAGIGLHFWLRTKPWYAAASRYILALELVIPVLALAGYVAGGNQMLREAEAPGYVSAILEDANISPATLSQIDGFAITGWSLHLGLLVLTMAAREARRLTQRFRKPAMLSHPSGKVVPIAPGATVLETLREHGIRHASVCGGRARCTTCRVQVTRGLERLHKPTRAEVAALARIQALPGMRLACQIRPDAELSILPLLPADAPPADGGIRGGLAGSEQPITVVFVDMRGSTAMAELRLPYDVLFILNQFFQEMTLALRATNGHYSQFTGDGLMAIYGLRDKDPARSTGDALRGAREMLNRVDRLNQRLRGELTQPLRIGIGIHFGEAIVGSMGPPGSRIVSAIGDTVNTAARLESLTKEFNCLLILSRQAAQAAGLDVTGHAIHETAIRGRTQNLEFYAFDAIPDIPAARALAAN
jgi:adenylate cyclase